MIIFIAAVGVLVSFFVVRAILGNMSTEPKKAPVIDKIVVEELEPDVRIFNSNSINPSVEVQIEGDALRDDATAAQSQSETENTEE